ncbi:MAG: hypothetical protein ABF904_03490 [Ethanoligenens sp.]
MEARPFRGGGPEFQPGHNSAQDNTARPNQTHRQMKTFHNMVQKAQQTIDDHGAKN